MISEANLQATIEKMKAALGGLEEAVCYTDSEGCLEWCNEAFGLLVKTPPSQCEGAPLHTLLPLHSLGARVPRESHPVELALRRRVSTVGANFDYVPGAESQSKSVEVSARLVCGGCGETSVVLSVRDVTRARERESRLVRNQSLLRLARRVNEASNQADSEDSAVRTVLRTACWHFGWDLGHYSTCESHEAEIVLKPRPIWHEQTTRALQLRLALEDRTDWWLCLGDWVLGRPGPIALSEQQCGSLAGLGSALLVPVLVGFEIVGWLEFYTLRAKCFEPDSFEWLRQVGIQLGRVVERKRSERDLRLAHAELEERVAARTQELAETNEVLTREIEERRRAERLKDELVATVSHELRTPLSSLLGFAELMYDQEFEREQQREFLAIMKSESIRLRDLINDFLDLQKIEAGKLDYRFQPLDIRTLLREAAALFGNNRSDHRFQLELPDDIPPVQADPNRIKQVIANYCSNALKFSPQGGDIILRAARTHSFVEVSVTDHGIGIAPEVLPRLFQKFYRADNADTRSIGGTGLGLALIKNIIAAHQGSVRAESIPGNGSTFFFSLPISAVPAISGGGIQQ